MDKPRLSFASNGPPDPQHSLRQYEWRAGVYDRELAWFEPLRERAVAALDLRPGQRVIDAGCGTGLSFGPLMDRLGQHGSIVGIEPCEPMLSRARSRVQLHAWPGIELLACRAEDAPITGLADAALFHFTHDILRSPLALENVLAHLRPGARVVATGLQWAGPWEWPANLFVWSAALYSVSTLEGLANPWSCLARYLPDLSVQRTWMGGVCTAKGVWPGSGKGVQSGSP